MIRKDLPPVHQLCQSIHAAHEAGIRFGNAEGISSLVVCSVPDEAALKEAQTKLEARGVKHYMFVEDDFGDQATALATEPLQGSRRRILSDYPLWKEGA